MITTRSVVGGGSINRAYRIGNDRQRLFLKRNSADCLDMFEAEAAGLRELAAPRAIRVPQSICFGATASESWLVCEYIDLESGAHDSGSRFGQQLAALHRTTSPQFGWIRNNTIGSTPQYNDVMDDWVRFFRERRLRVQFELAAENGFTGALQHKGDQLLSNLNLFFDSRAPEASLLHGDLWGGNYGYDRVGEPVIFDPATYYGDREADIAMTELFGGFGDAFYAAYHESWPLDPGYRVRKTLYNLYHILNHANLFGGGYAMQAESMIDRLLAEIRG